jgi:hypothetical protein
MRRFQRAMCVCVCVRAFPSYYFYCAGRVIVVVLCLVRSYARSRFRNTQHNQGPTEAPRTPSPQKARKNTLKGDKKMGRQNLKKKKRGISGAAPDAAQLLLPFSLFFW